MHDDLWLTCESFVYIPQIYIPQIITVHSYLNKCRQQGNSNDSPIAM